MNDAQSPNIVLTGFMGTGKSAVGQRIATETGRTFVDIDAEIIAEHGGIADLFTERGEEHFRTIEREMVSKFALKRNQVIATGGGTMLDQENVVSFLGAEIFTLTATPEAIHERVAADGIQTRPLLANSEDVTGTISRLLSERQDSYGKFTQIDTTDKTLGQVVDSLRDAGATLTTATEFNPEAAKGKADRILYVVVGVFAVLALILLVLVMSF